MLKKNYLPGLLAAATLTLLTLAVTSQSALAQDSGQRGQEQGEGTTSSAVNDDQRDNGSNWGWLGLAGLAGLAGLRRQPTTTTVVREDRVGSARAH